MSSCRGHAADPSSVRNNSNSTEHMFKQSPEHVTIKILLNLCLNNHQIIVLRCLTRRPTKSACQIKFCILCLLLSLQYPPPARVQLSLALVPASA